MGADPPAHPHTHDNLKIKEDRIVQQEDERNKSMILDIESDSIWFELV